MSKELDINNLDNVDDELPADLARARGDAVGDEGDDADPTSGRAKAEPPAEDLESDDVEDEEGEETEGERLAREAEEAEEAKKRRIRVPKARLDEEAAKRKRAEQELEALRAQLLAQQQKAVEDIPKGPTMAEQEAELEGLEDKYEEAVINGEREEARKLRTQIRAKRDAMTEQHVSSKAEEAKNAAYEQVQFDNFLAKTFEAYPELDAASEKYNHDAELEVMDIAEAFLAKGRSRVDAISRAVKVVLGAPAARQEQASEAKAAPKKPLSRAVDDAAKIKQPPSLKQAGDSGDKQPSLAALPEDEFNKLTAADLRAARGDTLE